jgi:hypothetical protein
MAAKKAKKEAEKRRYCQTCLVPETGECFGSRNWNERRRFVESAEVFGELFDLNPT